MIFLLDENFPKTAAQLLERQGHKVIDIRSGHSEGLDDKTIFKLAQDQKAIF